MYIYIGDTAAKMLERDTRKVRDSLPSDLQDLCHVQRKEDSTVQDASPVSSSHTLGFAIVAGALRATFGADLVISGFFRVAGGLFVAASDSKHYNALAPGRIYKHFPFKWSIPNTNFHFTHL